MEHQLEIVYYFSGIGLQEAYSGNVLSVDKRDVNYNDQDLKNCERIYPLATFHFPLSLIHTP